MERLIELFGHENCVHIMTNIPPPSHLNGQDMLLFDPSPSGQYSVKRVYNEINEKWRAVPNNCPELWQGIWKKGDIQPRVRLFLWKLVSGALPLAQSIASRIGAVSSTCVICSQGEEDAMHMVFQCQFARACWMSSGFPFRTDQLPGNLKQALLLVLTTGTEELWSELASIAWAIWRCQNARVYQGQQPSLAQFSSFLLAIKAENILVSKVKGNGRGERATGTRGANTGTVCNATGIGRSQQIVCYSDASWVNSWQTGIGFVLKKGEQLLAY